MHFFVMRVLAASPEKNAKSSSVAYVSCWINDASRDSAFKKAINLIDAQGWTAEEIIEDYSISREDYLEKPDGLDYFEQALIDGEVLVFFVPKKDGHE